LSDDTDSPHHAEFSIPVTCPLVVLLAACAPQTVGSYREAITAPPPAYDALCVTHGATARPTPYDVDASDPVGAGSFRAYASGSDGDHAEVWFTWIGDAAPLVKLADGSARRQECLKLRAADGCNLVYACWRVGDPAGPWLQVQVKDNPGQHLASQCGASGYLKATPTWSAPVADFRDGAPHRLATAVSTVGGAPWLSASVDGTDAWDGPIPAAAAGMSGPAGIRSDNVRWTGQLWVDADCSAGSGD